MSTVNRVPFKDLKGFGFFVDTVYEGGNDKNIGSEVLSLLGSTILIF